MPTTPSRDRYLFRPGRAAVALTAALILGCSSSSSGTSASPPELVIASVATGGAQGDNNSMYNSLSGDGRAVGFETQATNLGGSVTAEWNIYLREPASSRTTLLSRGWDNSAADGTRPSSFGSEAQPTGKTTMAATNIFAATVRLIFGLKDSGWYT